MTVRCSRLFNVVLDGARSDRNRAESIQRTRSIRPRVFVQTYDRKPGRYLTSDLIFERVAELCWAIAAGKRRVGEAVFHNECSCLFGCVVVEEEEARVHEPRE